MGDSAVDSDLTSHSLSKYAEEENGEMKLDDFWVVSILEKAKEREEQLQPWSRGEGEFSDLPV